MELNLWSALIGLIAPSAAQIATDAAPAQPKAPPERLNIDALMEALAANNPRAAMRAATNPFMPLRSSMPPNVGAPGLAMDQDFGLSAEWAMSGIAGLGLNEREGFIGYPELAILAQRPEYRAPVEIIAEDATSQWIEFQSAGEDENKSDAISKLEDEFIKFNVRDVFKKASEHDGFFGRGHIYVDLGTTDDPDELRKPIEDAQRNIAPAKVGKGKLKGFRTVEPVWCWPQRYNSLDPLSEDWYRPTDWFVMNKEIHASRFFTLIARPVPDLLKPAYMFGGMSLTSMMRPVVENWLKTRKSVGDAISNFSTMVLATNMVEAMNSAGSSANIIKRAELYNYLRDNRALFLIDKLAEEFSNVSMPLSGLSDLQAQSQEHMCSLPGIPVVKLLGIQPAGLNASSEGETTVYKQKIKAYQEYFFRPALTKVSHILQCNLFGKVDPDLVFVFKPLEEMTAIEKAQIEKIRAETATVHIQNRTISRFEERTRIANEPDAPYDSLDVDQEVAMGPDQMATTAQAASAAICAPFSEGITDRPTALRELRKLGAITGIGDEITDEMIKEAEEEPPTPSPEDLKAQAAMIKAQGGGQGAEGGAANGGAPQAPLPITSAQLP